MTEIQSNLLVNPQEYFHDKVSSAIKSLKVSDLGNEIEFYIVNLLCEFIDPTRINCALGEDEDFMDLPLAFMLKKALEAPPFEQIKIYKTLGDTSLYFSGFFQEYFNGKNVDINYYITMGVLGYNQASVIMRDRYRDDQFTILYENLAQKFTLLVDIIAEVSDTPAKVTPAKILSLYDRWTRCNSERLRRLLEKCGIDPTSYPKKMAQ